MSLYLANLLLAVVWAAVTGSFSFANFVLGFVLGAIALYLIRDQVGSLVYFTRTRMILALAILFLVALVLSAWRVAVLVMSPWMVVKPGIFAYPLRVTRDFEITLLASLITLTPGTL